MKMPKWRLTNGICLTRSGCEELHCSLIKPRAGQPLGGGGYGKKQEGRINGRCDRHRSPRTAARDPGGTMDCDRCQRGLGYAAVFCAQAEDETACRDTAALQPDRKSTRLNSSH